MSSSDEEDYEAQIAELLRKKEEKKKKKSEQKDIEIIKLKKEIKLLEDEKQQKIKKFDEQINRELKKLADLDPENYQKFADALDSFAAGSSARPKANSGKNDTLGSLGKDDISAKVTSSSSSSSSPKKPIKSNAGFDDVGGVEGEFLKYTIKNPKKYEISKNGACFTKVGRGFEVIRLGDPITEKTEVKFKVSNLEHSTAFRVLIGVGSADGTSRTMIASKSPMSYQIAIAQQTRWRISGEWDLNASYENTFHPREECEFVTVVFDPENCEVKITDHQQYKEVHKIEKGDRYVFWANICQKDAEVEIVHVKYFR